VDSSDSDISARAAVDAAEATPAMGEDVDFAEVLRRIPHRYPFVMIDRGENFIPARSMVGIKNVTYNEPYFTGHFPGNPVMPGVLLIEALAQTGAVLMSKSLDIDLENKAILFAAVDAVRFRSPVRPGDTVRMPVEVVKYRGELFKFRGEAYVGDKVVCEAEFAAMLVDRQK
jgi:3-hydroxyacyl-[acyl-carrier-protein] dehydratase